MDQGTVTSYRFARDRADLALGPGEKVVAGGTWLYSEPQTHLTGFVDITPMPWPHLEFPDDGGLVVAATCTIAELAELADDPRWRAAPLFFQCASALLASFKIWSIATVGGNICQSFSAAGMVSLATALDATALVWTAGGGEYRRPVAGLMTGNGTNSLAPGDVLRSVSFPADALRARTAYRKIALAELGRSGAVLTGRRHDDGRTVFGITAATLTPTVLRFPQPPSAEELRSTVAAASGYYTDPLGSADWRRGVSEVLLEEIRVELGGDE
ncbi:xanthine dehydrogenase family protein subunit M [Herbiconiux sp. L3-i23]|uniref:FAD binding domain-containing protein n=1 Tax=Herbiconiux sp. L3-i23 TaxID=2905871 RepID=UPI00205D894E|nr:FAD binding domain-containing protein [Herbiconiux sp. L3-i23]BDI21433.1 FAD-binding molybdopterin dehydrogenase [Herbiconiux sp. L3-i23]